MLNKTKIGIWVAVSLLLMFCFATVAFGAAASKNPPTSEQRYDGPAMVGTITVTYIDPDTYTALFDITVNINGDEKIASGSAYLEGISEDTFRSAGKELFIDYTLPGYIAQQLDCYDQLNVNVVTKLTHAETSMGPMIKADVVLLRVVAKK
jgi:hypothetical protein